MNILAVVPLFVEYWKMSCDVIWSPIDNAKALDAPLLPNAPSSMPMSELLRTVGSQKVKDGIELGSETEAVKLRVGDTATMLKV